MLYLQFCAKAYRHDDNNTLYTQPDQDRSQEVTSKIDRDRQQLPRTNEWPHHPVYLQGSEETYTEYHNAQSLPFGIPFEFETDLFKGRVLIKLKDDKGQRHVVVQGQFKQELPFSDIYYGDIYEKQFNPRIPPRIGALIHSTFRRLVPGVLIDLTSEKPKVQALIAGCSQSISINEPGNEPDMALHKTPENTTLLGKIFRSPHERKKIFSNPKHASKFMVNPNLMYTFQNYDNLIDIQTFHINIPFWGKFDLTNFLDGQPLSISSMTHDGRCIFSFRIWHERLLNKPQ